MLTKIQELVDVYYSLISMDHHKGKDSYFTIEVLIRPYEEVQYRAFHAGYINQISEYGYGPDRATYDEAIADLMGELKGFIAEELDFANRVLTGTGWGEEDIRQATAKIELLTAAGFDWLELKGN